MNQIIIRHDDLDGRLSTEQYMQIHEDFKKRNLIEYGMFQPTQWGRLGNFSTELFDYYKKEAEAGTFVVALHGWAHDKYSEMEYDFIVRDLMAAKYWCLKNMGIEPKLWGTPWNCYSQNMERAAELVGLEITNESYDIAKFIREVKDGSYSGNSLYFHGWSANEMNQFLEMLDLVVKENERRAALK